MRSGVLDRGGVFEAAPAPARDDAPGEAARPAGARLPFLPGLEGLRGLAVVAVLFFHGHYAFARGGFLGVSTFFTLSGFLITALLLAEYDHTGGIALRAFWRRRLRRLLPPALAALVLVVAFGALAADAGQRGRLAGDVIGSLGYSANWRFVLSGQSYADLFSAPSPVLHFWSLAIEQQFSLLYPIVALGLLRAVRGSRRGYAAILVVAIGASVLAGTMLTSQDRVYYGTDTRIAELLVGALVATVLTGQRLDRLATRRATPATVIAAIGAVALAASVVAWSVVGQQSAWLYRGGFGAYALVSAAVLLAAMVPVGPVAWLLRSPPMRWVGRISYGVYLYHWPIFLWLNADNTGFSGPVLFAYRVVVTFGVAWLSYHYLETPIRTGRPLFGIRTARALPVAGAIAAAVVVVSITAPAPVNDFASAQEQLAERTRQASSANGAVPPPAGAGEVEPAHPRIAVFGDSTMLAASLGLGEVVTEQGKAETVGGHTELGCGVGRGGERRSGDENMALPDRCNRWPDDWRDAIDVLRPDMAVVLVGPWDLYERRIPGDPEWRVIGDPAYDRFLRGELLAAVDTLAARGAVVVWLTSPPINQNAKTSGQPEWELADHPDRMQRFNDLLRELPALRPGKVAVVDLAGWLASTSEDTALRPDGVHLGDAQSRDVARRFLAGAILDAFHATWTARG